MRVVSGDFKGRTIDAPEGMGTRPTTDRVRESLFSSLYSTFGGFSGLNVLDAFAGSGALGIEALSRGACFAAFFERDRKAFSFTQRNLEKIRVEASRYALYNLDVRTSYSRANGRTYDIVFLDPPYATPATEVGDLVSGLFRNGLLSEKAVVCYEHDAHADLDALSGVLGEHFDVASARKYGKTLISILRVK